ncbi:MAG: S-layer homology domain-containing protein, partial [Clostridia bacterium]
RQEMFTLTCRVLKKSGVIKKDAPLSAADMFTDAAKIAPYARQPIATLTQNKLIEGDAKGKVNPSASASRAEGAVFLERVRVLIEKSSKD